MDITVTSHYQYYQCWFILYQTHWDKFWWNLKQNTAVSFQKLHLKIWSANGGYCATPSCDETMMLQENKVNTRNADALSWIHDLAKRSQCGLISDTKFPKIDNVSVPGHIKLTHCGSLSQYGNKNQWFASMLDIRRCKAITRIDGGSP